MSRLNVTAHTAYKITLLTLYALGYSHFMGVGFYLSSKWVYDNNYYGPNTPNVCWIYNSQSYPGLVIALPWYLQYNYIMYYSVGVITAIAYGDITPKNPIEVAYTIVAMIVQTVLAGYIFSEFIRLLMHIYSYYFERRFRYFDFAL